MLLETLILDRKTGEVIEIKTEETNEKIDYSDLIKFFSKKYLEHVNNESTS